MHLGRAGHDDFGLSIAGYQFPEAPDPRKRYSWYMVQGSAVRDGERWSFRWQALTCDEAPMIVDWLRRTAAWLEDSSDALDRPGPLAFTEPSLRFEATERAGDEVSLAVDLDLEFKAPRSAPGFAGSPTRLLIEAGASDLRSAADDLAEDIDRYPDRTVDA